VPALIERVSRHCELAGYGLRRTRLDQSGYSQGILDRGQYKSMQTDASSNAAAAHLRSNAAHRWNALHQ